MNENLEVDKDVILKNDETFLTDIKNFILYKNDKIREENEQSITDDSLKEKLDETIEAMKADGTLKAISEKYYGGQDLTVPVENADELPVIDVE